MTGAGVIRQWREVVGTSDAQLMDGERRCSGEVSQWRFAEESSHCEVRKAGELFHHLPAR